MDADELRKSMVQEVKQEAAKAEERVEATRLLDRLREQATVVRARFRAIGHGPERRKLDEIYRGLDGLIGKLKLAAANDGTGEGTARHQDLEEQAAKLLDLAKRTTGRGDTFRERVEKGRKKVVEKAEAGAGENTFRRIRQELNHLLNNYTPSNDYKIETLIDKWRRSGDPSYDPAIKLRYRNARRKKAGDDYAF